MSVRRRVPFVSSDTAEEDDHVLDEQEQEELIETLRKQSDASNVHYLILLQITLAFSCMLHLIFVFHEPKLSPLYAFFPPPPDTSPHTIAFPVLFGAVHILLHLNLSLTLLPPTHRLRRMLLSLPPPLRAVPIPLTHPAVLCAAALAPAFSLVLRCGWADVVWWALAGGMTALVWAVQAWISQSERGIRELEGLRYNARGA
ncbi:hypothetical protein BKA93DRAFT_825791 [Sparassis latifolia]